MTTFDWLRQRNRQKSRAFLSASLAPSSYHNEHVFPSRNLQREKDHVLASACKRLSSDISSLVP
jgi:hypothetical protein